jgi:hypothetical protein
MERVNNIMVMIGMACSFVIGFAKKKRFWMPAMIIYWGVIIAAVFLN